MPLLATSLYAFPLAYLGEYPARTAVMRIDKAGWRRAAASALDPAAHPESAPGRPAPSDRRRSR